MVVDSLIWSILYFCRTPIENIGSPGKLDAIMKSLQDSPKPLYPSESRTPPVSQGFSTCSDKTLRVLPLRQKLVTSVLWNSEKTWIPKRIQLLIKEKELIQVHGCRILLKLLRSKIRNHRTWCRHSVINSAWASVWSMGWALSNINPAAAKRKRKNGINCRTYSSNREEILKDW